MTLIVSEKKGTSFKPLEPGTYSAVCYLIADIGEQWHDPMNGQKEGRWTHEVMIGWQIVGEDIETDEGAFPYTMHKRFSHSLHPRAKLRQWLDKWRGKPFTAEEAAGFDLSNILGAGCLLQLGYAHEGSQYFDVLAVMALPKGTQLAKPDTMIAWDIDIPADMDRLSEMPRQLQNAVGKSKQVAGEKDITQQTSPDPAEVFGNQDELESLLNESDRLAF